MYKHKHANIDISLIEINSSNSFILLLNNSFCFHTEYKLSIIHDTANSTPFFRLCHVDIVPSSFIPKPWKQKDILLQADFINLDNIFLYQQCIHVYLQISLKVFRGQIVCGNPTSLNSERMSSWSAPTRLAMVDSPLPSHSHNHGSTWCKRPSE